LSLVFFICRYISVLGELTVSWDASDNPTASAIYSGYCKITTILPD